VSPVDRDALMNDYAAVSIPESVRADMAHTAFQDRTTLEGGADNHVDPVKSAFNEGMRACWMQFTTRIEKARRGKQAANEPAKAASATAEER
jgi:hypothetical protein